jgi:uncharacterized protein YigE (DUF2233 family)
VLFTITVFFLQAKKDFIDDDLYVNYIVNPTKKNIQFYWKNDTNENFGSIEKLKNWVAKKDKKLLFAMNGGMYKEDNSPQGLYIENNKVLSKVDTASGLGNFYLKPNGIFYLTKQNTPAICRTADFIDLENIQFATQSGPMLVINGKLHPAFIKSSKNINIRNGVGIFANNDIIFVMSKKEINFYDFASYFKSIGCTNALYLDGYVSRTYLPKKNWVQTDGNFGVIIGVFEE